MRTIKLIHGVRWSLALLLTLGAWLLMQPLTARAETIIVNTTVGESDGSCSDGDCGQQRLQRGPL